jgi:TonB-dependent SusC/RagA subfamily outer membrane receptor
MKRLIPFLAMGLFLFSATAQTNNNRLFDHPMIIKQMNVSVKADCFTAVTFVEMEFFNPNNEEIEGLFRFTLNPNQAITAFQLDLHGKYRDGSIEEKWKARNAYNTIVGKRIDPALLTKEGGDNYRLNIYPVPAKSSRKITMTIHQKLTEEQGKLVYRFGFNSADTAKAFKLTVTSTGCGFPTTADLIAEDHFSFRDNEYQLHKHAKNTSLKNSITFTVANNNGPTYCTQQKNDQTFFALRVQHTFPRETWLSTKKLLVFWDVSASAESRDIYKEMRFLEGYLRRHSIKEMSIITFNHEASPPQLFYPGDNDNWKDYLHSLKYDGATRMDKLNLADTSSDVVFLFSDGYVSYGSKVSIKTFRPLYAISSSRSNHEVFLKAISSGTGGSFIDLHNASVNHAISKASVAMNKLLSVETANKRTSFSTATSGGKNEGALLLYGTLTGDDTLRFTYGNASMINQVEKLMVRKSSGCNAVGLDRLSMLEKLITLSGGHDWRDLLEFGLEEKIVTQNTAYIVLERVEDYIKYNITPPKELEEECNLRGYISKQFKTRRQELMMMDEFDVLNSFVPAYNEMLRSWGSKSSMISLTRQGFDKTIISASPSPANTRGSSSVSDAATSFGASSRLSEVVVTSLGMHQQTRSLTYATARVQAKELHGMTIGQALAGRISGVEVRSTDGNFSMNERIVLRGVSSLSGNNQPLFIVDGFPFEGNINEIVSVSQIHNITVLKSAAATAMYGSRGSNGVILITTKKYNPRYHRDSRVRRYKLKHMEDIEYLQEIKTFPKYSKMSWYRQQREEYGDDVTFHLDIARHLFDQGLTTEASAVILNAAETGSGNPNVLRAIAYTYESWMQYDKATEIYRQLLATTPHALSVYRDLAWSFYQQGKVQDAVEALFSALKVNSEHNYYNVHYQKPQLLSEMNAIIAIHKDSLDISAIPSGLVQPMPSDLRIVLHDDLGYVHGMEVRQPNGKVLPGGTYDNNIRYQFYNFKDHSIRHAQKGKYRISVSYRDYSESKLPQMIRLVVFRNFGKQGQKIEVQNVMMNNQEGQVEVGVVEW